MNKVQGFLGVFGWNRNYGNFPGGNLSKVAGPLRHAIAEAKKCPQGTYTPWHHRRCHRTSQSPCTRWPDPDPAVPQSRCTRYPRHYTPRTSRRRRHCSTHRRRTDPTSNPHSHRSSHPNPAWARNHHHTCNCHRIPNPHCTSSHTPVRSDSPYHRRNGT